MSDRQEKKAKIVTVSTRPRASSSDSSEGSTLQAPSLKSPRTARFAEATAVNSPIDGTNPFKEPPTNHYMAQPQPSDVGFGYVNKHESVEMPDTDNNDYPAMKSPLKSPLKSAMKTPGAPPKDMKAIFSPTFTHDEILEKQEKHTDKEQARDLKIKVRVRMAKMMLRGVNFSCSLIVLSMLSATFTIFNATKTLPARNNLPAWAPAQKIWPQVTLISIASVSLLASVIIFYGYMKGGHKRAEKVAVYYTAFTCAFFVFSIVMWGIGAGVLQGAKNNSNGKDLWGWSCNDNTRRTLFENDVSYELICRLQNWSLLCCIIEVVVETITIGCYGFVFYRIWSKRKLRQSMAARDRARSDLYIAQLRAQSAPNTPGFAAPYSARDGGWKPPVDYYSQAPDIEEGTQYVNADQKVQPVGFRLQPAPIRTGSTPKMQQVGFTPVQTTFRQATPPMPDDQRSPLMADAAPVETQQEHFHAAPGEQVYENVPIPGAYEPPLSPSQDGQMHFPH